MTRSLLTSLGHLALLIILATSAVQAQIGGYLPFGANHPEVDWFQISTEHFRIIYHEGLEKESREAAAIAEQIYPVVTGNLDQPIDSRTPIYLSDLDDIGNALALGDKYIYVWMRGIVGDGKYGGLRAGGRTKWLRTVITHEFTHIVVDEAASFFHLFGFAPPLVPRWFNEGVARAMEPDGWTSDIDQVIRMAVVTRDIKKNLSYNLFNLGPLDGQLVYEGGQSFVRYLIWTYGEDVISAILHGGRGFFGYSFGAAVETATGKSLDDVQTEWLAALHDTYDSAITNGERIDRAGRHIPTGELTAIGWAAPSPDGKAMAFFGGRRWRAEGLFLADGIDDIESVSTAPGIDPIFSWHPDGASLLIAKGRRTSDRSLTHDIYRLDLDGDLVRITTDADLSNPIWSPDGKEIVAVRTVKGRDNLVRVDPTTGALTPLTTLTGDVQMHAPSWSPDGSLIAFGIFDARGHRVIAVVESDGSNLRTIVDDTANNRYPLWSPDGTRIAFTSHASGVPNIVTVAPDGSDRREITRLSDGAYATGWTAGGDSILVIAIESPDRILPSLVSAVGRSDTPTPPAARYDDWRGASFAQLIPQSEEVATPSILDEDSYHSLGSLHPILPFLFTYSMDVWDGGGNGVGFRPALITLWWDPLMMHQFIGYVDYGLASRKPGGELLYINNTLPVEIATHLDFSVASQGVLPGAVSRRGDETYFQQTAGGSITASLHLPDSDALDIVHTFSLGYERTVRSPLGSTAGIMEMLYGSTHTVSALGAGYEYSSADLLFNGSYAKALPWLGGSIEYDKLEARASARLPLGGSFSIVATGHAVAQMGTQLPYEFVGLHRYDRISPARGASFRETFDTDISVRGVEEWVFGDRAVVASAGVQTDLIFLYEAVSFLAVLRPNILLFAEAGSAWYATDDPPLPLAIGYGAELRIPYPLVNLNLALGYAQGRLEGVDLGGQLYVRFSWGF